MIEVLARKLTLVNVSSGSKFMFVLIIYYEHWWLFNRPQKSMRLEGVLDTSTVWRIWGLHLRLSCTVEILGELASTYEINSKLLIANLIQNTKVRSICLCLCHSSMVAWLLDILIGQLAVAWPIKKTSSSLAC